MISTWDFRYHCDHLPGGENDFAFFKQIERLFKKASWQLEKCPTTGRLHYQGRGMPHERMREGNSSIEFSKKIAEAGYFKPSTNVAKNDCNYVNKEYTSLRGPWTLQDPPLQKVDDVQYLDQHGLQPWQEEAKDIILGPVHHRRIDWIANTEGNAGKTALQKWLKYHHAVEDLDYLPDYKEFIQFVYNFRGRRAYSINIVKSVEYHDPMQRKQFGGFTGAVEMLKDGKVLDTRYSGKKDTFDRPAVIVFANQLPMFDNASLDRWRIWNVVEGRLVDVTHDVVTQHLYRKNEARQKHDLDRIMREHAWNKKFAKFEEGVQQEDHTIEAIVKARTDFKERKVEIQKRVDERSRSPRREPEAEPVRLEAVDTTQAPPKVERTPRSDKPPAHKCVGQRCGFPDLSTPPVPVVPHQEDFGYTQATLAQFFEATVDELATCAEELREFSEG